MIRKFTLVFAFILVSVSFATAEVNPDKGPNKLYVHIGIASPATPNEFKSGWTTGANVGITYSKNLPARLCLLASVDYNNFDFDSHGYADLVGSSGDLLDVEGNAAFSLGGTVGLKWRLASGKSSSAIPYLRLGLGANYFSRDRVILAYNKENVVKAGFSGLYPAVTLAFGSDLYLEGENLFAEPGVQIQMTPNQRTNFWYIKVGIGLHLF